MPRRQASKTSGRRSAPRDTVKYPRLDQAMAMMFTSQLKLAERQAASEERWLTLERRVDQVMAVLEEHSRILEHHGRILEALPDAIQKRIGFGPPGVRETHP
ncbi:MAG: hypothetical protein AB1714_10425 [Acidobacteriota bacterium]